MLLDREDSQLAALGRVLQAHAVRAAILNGHADADAAEDDQLDDDAPPSYLQGMNGICYVLLTVTGDEAESFEMLAAITDR